MKTTRRAQWRGDLAAIGVLGVLTLAVFWQGVFSPADMVREDAAYYYQPTYTFAATEVQAGRLPLWNPYTNLGIPYHAGLQASLFYPLRWPMFWCDYVRGYVLTLWLHYFLAGVAAYLLMRIALGVRPLAGLLGAMSIAFGGFAMGHLSHLTYFLAYPWFLGCFLFVWLTVQRGQWGGVVGAGVCIGMMGLIGAVHLLLILAVLLATYVIYHTVAAAVYLMRSGTRQWAPVMRAPAAVSAAAALGVTIAAVQLMPAYALSQRSMRQETTWEFINMACAHPARNSIQLVVPFYFGNHRLGYWGEYNYHGMAHYTGVVVLLAAAVGVVTLGRDRHLWFLVVLAAVGFLIGAGKYLPLYRLLYDWVPGFDQLRNPTRIFWCTDIAVACLAAVGIDRTLGSQTEKRRRSAGIAAVGAGVVIAVVLTWALAELHRYAQNPEALVRWVNENPNVFEDQWKPLHLEAARDVPRRVIGEFDPAAWGNIVAATVGAALLPVLILGGKRAGPVAAVSLIVLLAADLYALSLGTVQHQRQYHAITDTPPRARWLQQNLGLQRYLVLRKSFLPGPDDQIVRNRGMQFAIRNVNGVGGGILESQPRRQFCALTSRYPLLMDLAGVRYVFSEIASEHPRLRLLRQDDRYHVYENLGHLPLAFFVRSVAHVTDLKQVRHTVLSGRFNPRETALVFEPPSAETTFSSSQRARVTRMHTVPGRWEIETDTDAPAQLVISEGYDRGWRCRIGDEPVPIFQTNGQFMSVPVPAGQQHVVLEYAPLEFRWGVVVTLVGLLLAAALPLAGSRRRRKISTAHAVRAPPRQPASAKPAKSKRKRDTRGRNR